jgi:hypothetical protein
MEAPIEREI